MSQDLPPKDEHGLKIAEAIAEKNKQIAVAAEQRQIRAASSEKLSKNDRYLAPEQWNQILEKVRVGINDHRIEKEFGIAGGAIAHKRRREPAFKAAYADALEDFMLTIAADTREVARGVPGFSTGDIQRDRLIIETDLKLAKHFAPKVFGDRLQIDQRSLQIIVRDDGGDDVC